MVKKILSFLYSRSWLFWFIVIYSILSLLGMCFTPLFDEDEGFFAEASRQMLASNNFISIQVNGEDRYDKPALYFWFTALSLKLIGNNELAARLPSFLFFLLTIRLLYRFVSKKFSKSQAELSVIIAISLVQFQVLSRAVVSDNLLNLLIAAALFSFYDYLQYPKFKTLFWIYTFAGLGFFTKGPVAFVIIGLVIFVFLLLVKNWVILKKILNPFLIIWAFLIPLPWFILAYQKSGDFLFLDFIMKHNFGRFSKTMESHGGHILYYFPVLFLSFLPFSHKIINTIRNFKSNHKNLFLLVWFLVPLLLFSFSKTQLPHYISAGFLPFIVLMSYSKKSGVFSVFIQILILLMLFLVAPIVVKNVPISDNFVKNMLSNTHLIFNNVYFLVMSVFLFSLIFAFIYFKENLCVSVLIYCAATTLFIYKYSQLQQGFVKSSGLKLKLKNEYVYMVDHYNPSLSFYAQKVFPIKEKVNSGDKVFSKNQNFKTDSILQKGNGFAVWIRK